MEAVQRIFVDLQNTFGDHAEAVLATDAKGIAVFANRAMATLLQCPLNRIAGTPASHFFAHASQYEVAVAAHPAHPDQGQKRAVLVDLKRPDGTLAAAEVVSAPLFGDGGALSGHLVFVRDISDKRALESKLSDIALTLEDALDSISEGFALYDCEDRLIICNDNYREIYAASAPAIFPGNRFEDILRFGLNRKQYETGDLSDDEWIAERLERHQSANGDIIEQELQDGRWLRISETRTTCGYVAGIRADITEIKEAKAQAETAFKNLSLMADSVSACISELDAAGTCVFVNKTACSWFNRPGSELIGRRLREMFPLEEYQLLEGARSDAMTGKKVSLEAGLHFPDGQFRECQLDFNPRLNESGEVDGLVILTSDITDRKKTERTLAELYAITSTRELGHEEKIAEILRLGCEHFEMPFGIISQIADETYKVSHARSPNGELEPGATFPLANTYCTLTIEADGPIAAANVMESEFARHPCYEIFALEAYIGAPVLVDGLVHGTINFSSPTLRKRAFSSADIQIVRQFADWVGHEIARQRDHQALMNAKIDLERVASIDDLTQTLNRRAFLEAAGREIQRFRRTSQAFTAVMIDIDRFKLINDTYGHAAGDEVLKLFTATIKDALRSVDILGRIGGEEFCLILTDTGAKDAMTACERIRKRIVRECQFDGIAQTITCSMGLATASAQDVEFSGLLQKADTALYRAKETGRNRCVAFSEADSHALIG